MKILDWYIIKKFLGTFVFALGLFVIIAIVFDISEKIDDFLEKDVPLRAIVFDYYLNFIPYFLNLFSPLFIFISVVFFTSKMASDTEIVAILNSGVSFRRFLLPYIVTATFLCIVSYLLNAWVIPNRDKVRLAFEDVYINKHKDNSNENLHRKIAPGTYVYMESFNYLDSSGYRFSYQVINNNSLEYKMMADKINWNPATSTWTVNNFFVRIMKPDGEYIRKGLTLDTTFNFRPTDFIEKTAIIQTMNDAELTGFINVETQKGGEKIDEYKLELYKRRVFPFATIILTFIAVSVTSRKVRGGIGLHLGIGLLISFSYLLFMQFSTTFAASGALPAIVAVWIPNVLFFFLGLYLYRKAPK
jgi:lipopolysaccharide export system permease protein